jgi:hypothetical protein
LVGRMREDRFIRRIARISGWGCCLDSGIVKRLVMFCACVQPDAPGNTSKGIRNATKIRKKVSEHNGDSNVVDTVWSKWIGLLNRNNFSVINEVVDEKEFKSESYIGRQKGCSQTMKIIW